MPKAGLIEEKTGVARIGAIAFVAGSALCGLSAPAARAAVPDEPGAGAEKARTALPVVDAADVLAAMRQSLGLDALGVQSREKPDHLVQWAQTTVVSGPSKSTISDVGGRTQSQLITNRILANVLLGGNEQINCSNCFSAFGSVGSFSAGGHGRYNLTSQLSILGGVAFSQYDGKGYRSTSAPHVAVALRYDLADWGKSRPYFDIGVTSSPSQSFTFRRVFANGGPADLGIGKTDGSNLAAFAKAGWVFRLTPRDEVAVFGELWRSWQRTEGYLETSTFNGNTAIPATHDRMSIAKVGAQWTRLWGTSIETHVNGGVARTFGTSVGLAPVLAFQGLPAAPSKERTYFEYGARVGYRFTPKLVLDVFANGAIASGGIGNQIHAGTAIRYHF